MRSHSVLGGRLEVPVCDWSPRAQAPAPSMEAARAAAAAAYDRAERARDLAVMRRDVGRFLAWVVLGLVAGVLAVALAGSGGLGGGAHRSGAYAGDEGPACTTRAGCGW